MCTTNIFCLKVRTTTTQDDYDSLPRRRLARRHRRTIGRGLRAAAGGSHESDVDPTDSAAAAAVVVVPNRCRQPLRLLLLHLLLLLRWRRRRRRSDQHLDRPRFRQGRHPGETRRGGRDEKGRRVLPLLEVGDFPPLRRRSRVAQQGDGGQRRSADTLDRDDYVAPPRRRRRREREGGRRRWRGRRSRRRDRAVGDVVVVVVLLLLLPHHPPRRRWWDEGLSRKAQGTGRRNDDARASPEDGIVGASVVRLRVEHELRRVRVVGVVRIQQEGESCMDACMFYVLFIRCVCVCVCVCVCFRGSGGE